MSTQGSASPPARSQAAESYLSNLGESADLHARHVREGLWRQQGPEGQGRILDAQLQDERSQGLDKAQQRWSELNEHNATLITDLASKMGVSSLPPVSDPTGAITAATANVRQPRKPENKKQALTNQMLIDEIEKHEGRTLRQHSRVAEGAALPKDDFAQRNQEGDQLVSSHQAEYTFTELPLYSREDLYSACQLEITWDTILGLHARLAEQPGSDLYFLRTVQDLCDGRGDAASLIAALGKCHPDRNLCFEYAQAVVSFFQTSGKEFLDVPVILRMLRQSDPIIERLRSEIERKYDERRRFLEEREDFVAAERVHNEVDDKLEELLSVHAERLEVLEGAGQDEGFVDSVTGLGQRAKQLTAGQDELIKRMLDTPCAADVRRIDEHLTELKQQMSDDQERFDRVTDDLAQQLRDNAERQSDKFDLIQQHHNEVLALAEQRKQLVDQLLQQKHELESRKAASEAVVPIALQHRQVLVELEAILPRIAPTTQSVAPFIHRTLRGIADTVSDARRDTADTLLREQRAYYKVFHEFYMCCGELLYVQERRLEELEGQIEDLKWNVSMCRTVLDPNGKMYQERMKALELHRTKLDAEVAEMRKRMDQAAADASPIEEVLMDNGDEVTSPVILLQEKNARMQQEVLQARKAAVERRGVKVETQEEEVLRVGQQASIAKKSGGLTQQMRPLGSAPPMSPTAMSPEQRRDVSERRRRKYVERIRGAVDGDGHLPAGGDQSTVIHKGRVWAG